jgi:Family of unknown function (DUF5832)
MDSFDNTNDFRSADKETTNTNLSNKIPQCMKDIPVADPSREPLTEEQMKLASVGCKNRAFMTLDFPRKAKFRVDPPINGQSIGLISFYPSKNAVPDADGCFGVLKIRGNFPTMRDADNMADTLVRYHDTLSEIDFVHVGRDFPLFINNDMYTKVTREIDIQKTVDDNVRYNKKQQQEREDREIKNIQERQRALLDKTHEKEKETIYRDLDFYITLRVKRANALMTIDEAMKKAKEAEAVAEKTLKEIEEIEQNNPDYAAEYMERYKREVKGIGANIEQNPLISYMKKEDDDRIKRQTLETIKEDN